MIVSERSGQFRDAKRIGEVGHDHDAAGHADAPMTARGRVVAEALPGTTAPRPHPDPGQRRATWVSQPGT
jgi:hypothetical protein